MTKLILLSGDYGVGKSEFGKQIVESRKSYSYVKDDIVIDIVKHNID